MGATMLPRFQLIGGPSDGLVVDDADEKPEVWREVTNPFLVAEYRLDPETGDYNFAGNAMRKRRDHVVTTTRTREFCALGCEAQAAVKLNGMALCRDCYLWAQECIPDASPIWQSLQHLDETGDPHESDTGHSPQER